MEVRAASSAGAGGRALPCAAGSAAAPGRGRMTTRARGICRVPLFRGAATSAGGPRELALLTHAAARVSLAGCASSRTASSRLYVVASAASSGGGAASTSAAAARAPSPLPAPSAPEPGNPLAWSVVVPTWNRRALLHKCLAALERQDAARPDGVESFEVVVVDDGSDDGTIEWFAAAAAAGEFPHVRLLKQDHGGPARVSTRSLGRRMCVPAALAPLCFGRRHSS